MEAADERAHDRDGDVRMLLQEGGELPRREEEALRLDGRDDGCRTRVLLDQRELAEEVARLHLAERLAAAHDATGPAQDDVERRAGRALADDLLVRRIGAAFPGLGETVSNAGIEPREQWHRCELLLELHRRVLRASRS